MSHPRGRAAPAGATLVRLLLAMLFSGAFAACGSPTPVASTGGAVYGMVVGDNGTTSLVALRGKRWRATLANAYPVRFGERRGFDNGHAVADLCRLWWQAFQRRLVADGRAC